MVLAGPRSSTTRTKGGHSLISPGLGKQGIAMPHRSTGNAMIGRRLPEISLLSHVFVEDCKV